MRAQTAIAASARTINVELNIHEKLIDFVSCRYRVSFGSSKGSMVETLIFETPTPLPEHAEREFFSSTNSTDPASKENDLNDSGIELQEE